MFKSITLEMSFKPFKKTDDEYIRAVCRKMFKQWYPLLKDCNAISVMLWIGDGSEILDYDRNMDREIEWGKYLGTANNPFNDTGDDSVCLHKFKYLYMDNPPTFTYKTVKRIVEILKEEGKSEYPEKKISVGDTFDIGPEFAVSDFKYKNHTEICTGEKVSSVFGMVDCTALLHADNVKYATYPNGIPEGTPVGLFLGKQTDAFLRDMNMDFIWLSNGFGFSADPWSLQGKVFDGETFNSVKLYETKKKVFEFWKLFREGCPDFPIRVRGTNNTVGIDYATDAVPTYDIYNGGFNIDAVPNSPWAALNDNYGLEIMGHLTRNAELPCEDFLFRYYIHDPWWVNSPWYDRYGGAPMDIYLPLAVTRIDENGNVKSADSLNILTIDNSFGDMPDACVNEPLPHILKAKKDAGDRPAPFLLLYPFREYSVATEEATIRQMYSGDNYIIEAINNSLPLNCVISTDNFLKVQSSALQNSVIISPVPETDEVIERLCEFKGNGGRVVLYGTTAYLERIKGLDFITVNTETDKPSYIREALRLFGYYIDFYNPHSGKKTTTITVANSNNGLFFSLYNQTTLAEMQLKFPLGVPIFNGTDAQIENGVGKYRFSRSEHLECRVFVNQENGIVSMREKTPSNKMYRRRIELTGLKNATVCYFPEEYCAENGAVVGPLNYKWYKNPVLLDDRFKVVTDRNGTYLKGENISDDLILYMPFKGYCK